MKNIDSKNHVTGKSVYVDDILVQTGTLYGAIFGSPKAHGKIINIDFSEAESLDGVERIFTFKDIQGRNQIGGIIEDEMLFAENEVQRRS
jgi:xanthine dehydrogenase large subunit